MARNTQEAEVIVTMNGEAAKKTLAEITKKYQDLNGARHPLRHIFRKILSFLSETFAVMLSPESGKIPL